MNAQKIFENQLLYFQSVARLHTVSDRLKTLRKIDQWIVAHEAAIIEALKADFQKPLSETLLSEIKLVRDEIKTARKGLRQWARPVMQPSPLTFFGTRSTIVRQPKGPSLVIGAWNYPFTLSLGPCISAIAAGCTVVVKPSEKAPATSRLIKSMTEELFDPAYIAAVEGGIPETQSLLEQPWGHVFFTGSKRVGKIVMAAAAQHLSSVTLELGGENPVLIHRSANLKDAARQIVWGKFLNAGQTCIAPNHLFVDRAIYDRFQPLLQEAVADLYQREIAHPLTDQACLIDEDHYERMQDLLQQATQAGATFLVQGQSIPEERYLGPTILKDVPADSPVVQQEVFGPILSLLPYDNVQEVYQQIDRQDPALALYIFAREQRFIKDTIDRTTAGTTVVNTVNLQFAQPHLPFGGVGSSGMGKAHGRYGYEVFTHPRAVIKKGQLGVTNLIFPPFTPLKQKIIRFVYRWL